MFNQFIEYCKTKRLFNPQQKLLLAVSGGIDSMVLLNLFEKTEYVYGVVHCNFQLRGAESDQDEEFVKQHVINKGIPFFCTKFDTEEYANINGISIEMAARDLRYEYFEQIREENDYDVIVTAHHQDDLVETFFLNLSRKTGIKGLTGIKEKTGNLVRPLLFAARAEIEKYATDNFISFREDRTNNEVVYKRNFIRHRILPLFTELTPSFKKNLFDTIQNLREAEDVYKLAIENEKKNVVDREKSKITVDIKNLKNSLFPKVLLYEILSEYCFNPQVINQVFWGLDSVSGKQYFSKTHRLVKDRELLFITNLPQDKEQIYYIEENDIELFEPFNLNIEKIKNDNFQIVRGHNVACIDLDKLEFPLLIRKWRKGDYFQPLGMKGFKKLSDFFIDEKIPLHEKENLWLLCCGQKIVWVINYRIDNRFKITDNTKNVFKIVVNKK